MYKSFTNEPQKFEYLPVENEREVFLRPACNSFADFNAKVENIVQLVYLRSRG